MDLQEPLAKSRLSFWADIGLETTLKRPIINIRDEPDADPGKGGELHVIIGDANTSEVCTYLKVGTTSLVLATIEAARARSCSEVSGAQQTEHEDH